jgi:hypothetical protein
MGPEHAKARVPGRKTGKQAKKARRSWRVQKNDLPLEGVHGKLQKRSLRSHGKPSKRFSVLEIMSAIDDEVRLGLQSVKIEVSNKPRERMNARRFTETLNRFFSKLCPWLSEAVFGHQDLTVQVFKGKDPFMHESKLAHASRRQLERKRPT